MPESTERGALTEAVFYILLSLYSPLHGYAIMQNIRKLSAGRVVLGAGTLYGALNTLLEKKWISEILEDNTDRKKLYLITDLGKEIINNDITRLEELLKNGKIITGNIQNYEN